MARGKKEDEVLERIYEVRLTLTEAILGAAPSDKAVYTSYIAAKKAEILALAEEGELDELETLPSEEKGMTVFHQLPDGTPFLYDYVIRGFFKDACSMLRRNGGRKSVKLTAFRKIIDGHIFVEPRRIPLALPTTIKEPIVVTRPNPDWSPLTHAETALLEKFSEPVDDDQEPASDAEVEAYVRIQQKVRVPKTVKKVVGYVDVPAVMDVLERPLRGQTAQGERVALAKSQTLPAGTTLEFRVIVQSAEVTEEILREWFDYGRRRGLGQWRNGGWGTVVYEMREVTPLAP